MIHPFFLLRISAALVLVHPVADTSKAPCGWDPADLTNGQPQSIAFVLGQVKSHDGLPPDVVANISKWVNSCDATAAHVAADDLRRFADKHPADPAIDALHAIILARGPEIQLEGVRGSFFRPAYKASNAEQEASRLFQKALRAQHWADVAVEFGDLALVSHGTGTLKDARKALLALTVVDDGNAAAWGKLADVAMALGDTVLLMKASARAIELGDDLGAHRHAVAQLMHGVNIAAASKEYFGGLATSDERALALYREDIAPLLTDAEVTAWNGLAPSEQRDWLRKAWEWRASIATLTLPARMSEHFRRVQYALQHYFRIAYRGGRPNSALWLDPALAQATLNDQGLVYVRHGAPDTTVVNHTRGDDKVAWYYRSLGGGRALLEFKKSEFPVAWPEYFLAEPFQCSDRSFASTIHPTRALVMLGKDSEADYVESLLALDPSIQPDGCYNTIAGDTGNVFLVHQASGQARRLVSQAVMQTETAAPRLRKSIDALLNTYAFKRGNQASIAAFTSINGGELTPDPNNAYRLNVFAALENAGTHSVTRSDTSFRVTTAQPLQKGDALDMTLLLTGDAASSSTVRVAIRNAADTLQGQTVSMVRDVPDYRANALMSSDIVIGRAGGGKWIGNEFAPVPLAGHRLNADQSFVVYYELYGSQQGAAETTLSITPEPRRGMSGAIADLVKQHRAISTRYTEQLTPDTDSTSHIRHDVQAALEPGAYFVDVTTTTGGKTTHARTTLTVYKQ